MAQWLERGALLLMSLPAVRYRAPLGAGFSEKYHVSPFQSLDIVQCYVLVQGTLPSNASLDLKIMAMLHR